MCGIAGWFSERTAAPDWQATLTAMVAALAHRGPDGQGQLVLDHAALGHARLAIIDPASGQQPMSSADGRHHLVFNGEIYNFAALRSELVQRGHKFRTRSDTEVILALYAEHGARGFDRLRGMFAFALWDSERRVGLLVRDPAGIKPLFFSRDKEGVSFGSEAKALLATGRVPARLDLAALHLLLNFRYVPGDASLFQDIGQVPPGTVLTWTPAGTLRSTALAGARADADTPLLEVLREAVTLHLNADVEVGTYLSGGIDSAAVTALAAQAAPTRLRTFTLAVGDDPDEAANAARSAELLDVDNVTAPARADWTRDYERLVWHLEAPKVNAFQVSDVARLAARHVKVVLSGLGGDELFLGYNAHAILARYAAAADYLPAASVRTLGAGALGVLRSVAGSNWSEPERGLAMMSAVPDWWRVYGLLRNVWDAPAMRSRLYGPRLLDADLPDAFTLLRSLWPAATHPVAAMARFEWRHKLVNDLLWQEDRASMAEGLEVRVPFLDPVLAATVQALPWQRLMQGGAKKALMRSMLAPLLPGAILDRPKSGFQVDAPVFFHRALARLAERYLDDGTVARHGLFNPQFVRTTLAAKPDRRWRWHYFMLYLMLGTHVFIDLFETTSASGPRAGAASSGAPGPTRLAAAHA